MHPAVNANFQHLPTRIFPHVPLPAVSPTRSPPPAPAPAPSQSPITSEKGRLHATSGLGLGLGLDSISEPEEVAHIITELQEGGPMIPLERKRALLVLLGIEPPPES
ncbi:hypothetical protein I317_05369 [Kwoniella heveanensis CBS 569]|uniref:Uncharacterized protein n=1 Tax=Kwoniella heveanensis BCC8398 TaxID=1296120 RepID=A0A1B9H3K8_9TREE|nr:hypothetical protein I316_00054 [Kwoniella heveanensis BCC8398]OCF40834.1 hypothetical protein I317_05369 [Kwoniella heveanensis CBS 569]